MVAQNLPQPDLWFSVIMRRFLVWSIALAVIRPIGIGAARRWVLGWPSSWRAAKWRLSELLPAAKDQREAEVLILGKLGVMGLLAASKS